MPDKSTPEAWATGRRHAGVARPQLAGRGAEEIDNAVASKLDDLCFTEAELAVIEAGAGAGLDRIATKRKAELDDLSRKRDRIFADLDYLRKNKIFLLRTGAARAEDYALDVAQLEGDLELVYRQMEVYKDAESDMLQYVLSFSALVKAAGRHYRDAVDSEKRELAMLAFTELKYDAGKPAFTPKDAFSFAFLRNGDTKNTQEGLSAFSGSEAGIRTLDQ